MAQSMTEARGMDNCPMAKVCFAFHEGFSCQALK